MDLGHNKVSLNGDLPQFTQGGNNDTLQIFPSYNIYRLLDSGTFSLLAIQHQFPVSQFILLDVNSYFNQIQ